LIQGRYEVVDPQARSWKVAGTSSNNGGLCRKAPQVLQRGVGISSAHVTEGVLPRVKSFVTPTTHQLGGAERVGI